MEPVLQLSPAGKARIKALSGARPGRFALTLVTTWLTIAVTLYFAVRFGANPVHIAVKWAPFHVAASFGPVHWYNVLVTLFCLYFVATRQNLLALLIHEQTHHMGLNSRQGDNLVNMLAAYPLGTTVENYAKVHLRHHKSYFTLEDPDFIRKNGPNWMVPMPASKLFGLFLRDLSGLGFLDFVRGKKNEGESGFKRRFPPPKWMKPAYYLVAAVLLSALGGWPAFLAYWVLPLVTVFMVIVRWGALCEHIYGQEGASVGDTSPVILPTLLGNIFLPNLHFAMHSYHHYFVGISFGNLPEVHKVFEDEGLVRTDRVFKGHLDYLRFVVNGTRDHQHAPGLTARSA